MRHLSFPSAKRFGVNFCRCGLLGWCMECFWTGLSSLRNSSKDPRLFCRTSVWMFPIYGLAAFIPSVYNKLKTKPACLRGSVYAFGIFFCEFISGSFLKKYNACPWDYSDAKLNYKGLIRLDYAPCWAVAGLLFERILCRK